MRITDEFASPRKEIAATKAASERSEKTRKLGGDMDREFTEFHEEGACGSDQEGRGILEQARTPADNSPTKSMRLPPTRYGADSEDSTQRRVSVKNNGFHHQRQASTVERRDGDRTAGSEPHPYGSTGTGGRHAHPPGMTGGRLQGRPRGDPQQQKGEDEAKEGRGTRSE